MMKKRVLKILSTAVILLICASVLSFAHSGRTDSNGGHRDNKNKSGLGYYHYHCGGFPPHLHDNGVCPYKSADMVSSKSDSELKKAESEIQESKKENSCGIVGTIIRFIKMCLN